MSSTWKTAEESRAETIAAMGADLGEIFHVLSNEVTWLHWQWHQYRALFVDKPTRIDLLNSSAPFFFRLVQDTFFENTLLGIARLVGSPKSMGKPNLSITRLPPLVLDPTLAATTVALVDDAKAKAAFAVDWRNRRIAHRDLDLALDRQAVPLASATVLLVDDALKALDTLLNRLEAHYRSITTAYSSSSIIGDATELLYIVRDGLRREELRQKRLEDGGKYNPEDWNDDLPAV